jgi:hypothetical protein
MIKKVAIYLVHLFLAFHYLYSQKKTKLSREKFELSKPLFCGPNFLPDRGSGFTDLIVSGPRVWIRNTTHAVRALRRVLFNGFLNAFLAKKNFEIFESLLFVFTT